MNWSKVAGIGLRVASVVVPQIGLIESVAKVVPSFKGQQKEDAVVALSHDALKLAEAVVDTDLLGDPQFDSAVRQFVRAYVALQNVVASRHVAPESQPAQSTAAILEHKPVE